MTVGTRRWIALNQKNACRSCEVSEAIRPVSMGHLNLCARYVSYLIELESFAAAATVLRILRVLS